MFAVCEIDILSDFERVFQRVSGDFPAFGNVRLEFRLERIGMPYERIQIKGVQQMQVSRIVVIAVTGEGSDVVWLST